MIQYHYTLNGTQHTVTLPYKEKYTADEVEAFIQETLAKAGVSHKDVDSQFIMFYCVESRDRHYDSNFVVS